LFPGLEAHDSECTVSVNNIEKKIGNDSNDIAMKVEKKSSDVSSGVSTKDYKSMIVAHLKHGLRSNGLKTTGRMAELLARLEARDT
jgi:hypothetical protein